MKLIFTCNLFAPKSSPNYNLPKTENLKKQSCDLVPSTSGTDYSSHLVTKMSCRLNLNFVELAVYKVIIVRKALPCIAYVWSLTRGYELNNELNLNAK